MGNRRRSTENRVTRLKCDNDGFFAIFYNPLVARAFLSHRSLLISMYYTRLGQYRNDGQNVDAK